ncbi:hypothetical protein TNCV_536871 [Trichonephila clavipes]|nr:hypothetical protein TNCV_536871 [Trichonephila clavipes]
MAPWPRAPVIPQLVDRKTFRDNRWRLEPIVENSACVEVGTHRRKFRLCRGRNYNFTNTCEEVSIRTISTILPAKR